MSTGCSHALVGLLGLAVAPSCVRPGAPIPARGATADPAAAASLVRITCSSRAAAQALLSDPTLDTGDTGGARDLGGGAWAVDVVVASGRIGDLLLRPGVSRVDLLQDPEANRLLRLRELQGRPAFQVSPGAAGAAVK